ncbi:MAG: hypothetical protein HONDAALG_03748 [Gammaproteobacteria bacterium]|nr:hypothetical protein [Gammaproteobacteria bacterium]
MTTDTITLKRKFNDEPSPRYYSMSGGEFTAMKDAVKAAGGTFETMPLKVWKVKKEAVAAIKEAGYTVTLLPFLRMVSFNERNISDSPEGTMVKIAFEYINDDGRYREVPGYMNIQVGIIDDDAVAAANEDINAEMTAAGLAPSPYLNRHTAVRKIAREAAEAKAAEVVAMFDAASGGKRTAEALKAGFTAVMQVVK